MSRSLASLQLRSSCCPTRNPYTTLFRSVPPGERGDGHHLHVTRGMHGFFRRRSEPGLRGSSRDRTAVKLLRALMIGFVLRSEEHTSELQSRQYLVCRRPLEKKK